jgi:hypothetical protein
MTDSVIRYRGTDGVNYSLVLRTISLREHNALNDLSSQQAASLFYGRDPNFAKRRRSKKRKAAGGK